MARRIHSLPCRVCGTQTRCGKSALSVVCGDCVQKQLTTTPRKVGDLETDWSSATARLIAIANGGKEVRTFRHVFYGDGNGNVVCRTLSRGETITARPDSDSMVRRFKASVQAHRRNEVRERRTAATSGGDTSVASLAAQINRISQMIQKLRSGG